MSTYDILRAYWKATLRRFRWLAHPITIFVLLQLAWLATTLIWVIWFVGESAEIAKLAQTFGRNYFEPSTVLVILIVGCVLLGVVLVGTIILFVFGQRQSYLARQQRSFVSSVTHELKSPLASLQLTMETMKKHKPDEATVSKMTDMALTDIERLRRTVDQILVAGRLDRIIDFLEKGDRGPKACECLRSIVTSLRYLDPSVESRIEIRCDPEMTLPFTERTMSLILTNLLENAVKYSPRETPIQVMVKREAHDVVVQVKDQGFGLDRKEKRRIFRMFHRSESADRRAIPGTGLGLYIVKSVVMVLGGRVWVDSPGKNLGSTFFVSLPVRIQE